MFNLNTKSFQGFTFGSRTSLKVLKASAGATASRLETIHGFPFEALRNYKGLITSQHNVGAIKTVHDDTFQKSYIHSIF